jgi:hypothetical protein
VRPRRRKRRLAMLTAAGPLRVRAGPDLGLCDLVRRPGPISKGAHNFVYPSTYIPIHLKKTVKPGPARTPAGNFADLTPRGPRSRSQS